ncbi:MAG: hypothetical protein K0R28_6532 [Paenibacillus sp.]|nr:hypothetical protein [Paenibacillus sp.]
MGAAILLLASITVGCAGGGTKERATEPAKPEAGAPAAPVKQPDPVTVKIAANKAALTAEEIKMYVTDPLAKKHPHITVEMIDTAEKGKTLTDLVAAKEIPDIYANFPLNMNELVDLKLFGRIADVQPVVRFVLQQRLVRPNGRSLSEGRNDVGAGQRLGRQNDAKRGRCPILGHVA